MPGPVRRRFVPGIALALALVPLSLAACGSDDKSGNRTSMSITTTDLGKKKFKMVAPASVKGGAIDITFHNDGKVPHEAQLLSLGNHTVDEALKIVSPDKVVLPDWLRAEGGVGTVKPGQSGTATVKLKEGNYAVIDTASDNGPPPAAFGAKATFKVTGDNGGDVKDADPKIESKSTGKDKYEWVVSGLKAGTNDLTFDNTSKEIHLVAAAPMSGNATIAQVKKYLATQGQGVSGPPPIAFDKITNTSIIDGKRKENAQLTLKPGRYALICFLSDRDGKGKSHDQEGLLKEVTVK